MGKAVDLVLKYMPKPVHKRVFPIVLFFFHHLRKKNMLRLYSTLISKGDLVFDVGTNEGYMSEIFLELGAKVICIEPQPECVSHLKKRFKGKEAIIVGKGLAEKKGELKLLICEKRPGVSTFSEKWKKGRHHLQSWNKEIKVPVTTLNELIKEFGTPKFCKIDVEGFELNVLKGLNKKIPFICFEFHREFMEDAKACIKHLESLGKARFNLNLYNKQKLDLEKWIDSKQLLNYLDSIKDKNLSGDIYVSLE